MKTIGFFNNKGGVGKTSLVYHLSWMFSELRLKVIAADLDPQANLTSFFFDEEELERIWGGSPASTIHGAVSPLFRGIGDITPVKAHAPASRIRVLAGDLALSRIEDDLSHAWATANEGNERAFRVLSAFWRSLAIIDGGWGADVALIDVGPNLGAINRAALISCDYVVIPLGPDLFSLQGLRNMGPTLREWNRAWNNKRTLNPDSNLELPSGSMTPVGYVLMRHSVRLDRPVQAYQRWINRIPREYRTSVLDDNSAAPAPSGDPHCLAQLKDYRSLMPMAQEAQKPMFLLKPADGAIGGHQTGVFECYRDFQALARAIATRCAIRLPV